MKSKMEEEVGKLKGQLAAEQGKLHAKKKAMSNLQNSHVRTGLQRQPSATMFDGCFTLVQNAAVTCQQPSVASDPMLDCCQTGEVPLSSSSSCNCNPADQACCCCHALAAEVSRSHAHHPRPCTMHVWCN